MMGIARFYKVNTEQREEILNTLKAVLLGNPNIIFAYSFGSFHDGDIFRDIDVGVFVRSLDISVLDYEMKLAQHVEDHLPGQIPVEVKVINQAPLAFRFHVILGELLFSRDDDILERFMTETARRYLDFAPLRRRYIREALSA